MTRRLMVFDLDGTLAQSKSALDGEMADLLVVLLGVVPVAIISGGDWPQFQAQVLGKLPPTTALDRLALLPTCGTKCYRFAGGAWTKVYSEDLSADERRRTLAALGSAMQQSDFKPERTWGDVVEDRGTQITYSALGQSAPLEAKMAWDPDFVKRTQFKAVIDTMIPDLSVHIGGATSVDITKPGIDKGYGIRKLDRSWTYPSPRCSSWATRCSPEATTSQPARREPRRSKYATRTRRSGSLRPSSPAHADRAS